MKIWPIPSSIFPADVPDRGENGMFEGEYIFKAQKKWLLVNLSIDKRLWKIDQNIWKIDPAFERLTKTFERLTKTIERLTKPLKEKGDQNLWKVDFISSFLNFSGTWNRQSSFFILIFYFFF